MNKVKIALDAFELEPREYWTLFKPYSKITLKKKRNRKKFRKDTLRYLGPNAGGVWIGLVMGQMVVNAKKNKDNSVTLDWDNSPYLPLIAR